MKTLIVNADDFGFTRDVNAGIIEAHRHGILTATTLMAGGGAFGDAVRLAREHPSLDIGVHLVLVGQAPFPPTVAQLACELAFGRIEILDALRAQVRKIKDSGLQPTHLDTHKHTHLLPPVLDAVGRISEEFGIPWVRRPFDLPLAYRGVSAAKRVASTAMSLMQGSVDHVLRRHECRFTDHFAGFQITGGYGAAELAALVRELPEGSTEFMCHPAVCGEELRGARTRLKESRERELRALTSPEVLAAVRGAGIELTSFRDARNS